MFCVDVLLVDSPPMDMITQLPGNSKHLTSTQAPSTVTVQDLPPIPDLLSPIKGDVSRSKIFVHFVQGKIIK